jgi:hypothetical protein
MMYGGGKMWNTEWTTKGRERVPAAVGSEADGAVPCAGKLICPVRGQLRRSGGAPEGAGAKEVAGLGIEQISKTLSGR